MKQKKQTKKPSSTRRRSPLRDDQLSSSKRTIRTSTTIACGHAYVLIEDACAGSRNRFTLYKMQLFGDKSVEIIGREITPKRAEKIIRAHAFGDVLDASETA